MLLLYFLLQLLVSFLLQRVGKILFDIYRYYAGTSGMSHLYSGV